MTEAVALVGGVSLMSIVFVDLVWTALGVSHGSGPMTASVLRLGWRASSPLRRRRSHGLLTGVGLLTVLSAMALWVILLWAAWSLIFLVPSAGVVDRAGRAAGTWDRVYFAGYSLFTLGNGDFQPEGAIWQIATVAAALSGLTVVSFAIAYLVLVTSAAADRQALAVRISLLGESPSAVVKGWWVASERAASEALLTATAAPIVELTQRHLAYPALHFFHSAGARSSPPVAIAVLDDALTILMFGVAQEVRPSGPAIEGLRRAIDDYLGMVGHHYGDHTAKPPPLLLDDVGAAGVPLVGSDEFDHALRDLLPRRRALHGLVAAEGFTRPG